MSFNPKRTHLPGSGSISGSLSGLNFPVVRRVFAGLVANEIVAIQPMTLPASSMFYLNYQYGGDGAINKLYAAGLKKRKP